MLLNDLVGMCCRVMVARRFCLGEARDAEVELMAYWIGAPYADLYWGVSGLLGLARY